MLKAVVSFGPPALPPSDGASYNRPPIRTIRSAAITYCSHSLPLFCLHICFYIFILKHIYQQKSQICQRYVDVDMQPSVVTLLSQPDYSTVTHQFIAGDPPRRHIRPDKEYNQVIFPCSKFDNCSCQHIDHDFSCQSFKI